MSVYKCGRSILLLPEHALNMEKRPRVRAALAVVKDGQLLLVEHTKKGRSYWLLPGGGLEWGEALTDAVVREVLEETGLTVTCSDLLYASETISPDGEKHLVHLVFGGRYESGEIVVPEEERITDVKWVPLTEVPSLILHPPMQEALSKIDLVEPSRRKKVFLGNLWVD